MRMRHAFLVCLLASIPLAGCLGDGQTDDKDTSDDKKGKHEARFGLRVHDGAGNLLDASAFGKEVPKFKQLHVTQRISGEPTIGVTRTGAVFYPAIDFDAVNALPLTMFMRSVDGGATWEDHSPHVGHYTRTHPYSFDPYVYVDPTTGRVFALDMGPNYNCNHVSWSDNDGRSWMTQYFTCPVPVVDHPSIFAGPATSFTGSDLPGGYPNHLYLCTNALAAAHCVHSPDGGMTWIESQPAFTECGGLTGHGHASWADGTIYLPRASCGPEVAISRDGGLTFSQVSVASGTQYDSNSHEAIVATDTSGTAYFFWVCQNGRAACLSVSKDMGATWSEPMNVTAPGVTALKLPSITAGSDGRIAFLYVGTETPSGWDVHRDENTKERQNATWNAYVGMSLDADSDDPVFATTTVNSLDKPIKRGSCQGRCFGDVGGMYDFFDIDIDPISGRVWVAMVDVCTMECDEKGADASAYQRTFGAVGKQVGGPMLLTQPIPAR